MADNVDWSQVNLSSLSESDGQDDTQASTANFDLAITQLLEDRVPLNTRRNTNWALKKFNKWIEKSSFTFPSFDDIPHPRLNYVLSRFLVENFQKVKHNTVYNCVSALNRHFKDVNPGLDLLSTPMFTQFRNVVDGLLKQKQATQPIKDPQASVLTEDEITEILLGTRPSVCDRYMLLEGLIFQIARVFCLRGGDELASLTIDSITVSGDSNDATTQLLYVERRSKNKQGGLSGLNRTPKKVPHTDYNWDSYSLTAFLQEYFSHLPSSYTQEPSNRLFLHPRKSILTDPSVWYQTGKALGKAQFNNHFNKLVKRTGIRCGPDRNLSLRSIRATTATILNGRSLTAAEIKQRTGHSTSTALFQYIRPGNEQTDLKTSLLINATSPDLKRRNLGRVLHLSTKNVLIFIGGIILGVLFLWAVNAILLI